jgi:hypothetical protein
VLDGASEVPLHVLGDSGKHSRVAIGVLDLPWNVAIEVGLVATVGPKQIE